MKPLEIWDSEQSGQPPTLQPFIGRRVYRAWILPSGKTLAMRMEGGKFLMIKAMPAIGLKAALHVETGDEIANADWSDMEMLKQTPHLIALRGMTFTGLDCDVLMFGEFGAQITLQGIRWVRQPNPERASI